MEFAQRLLRRVGYLGWGLLSVVLTAIAGAGLAGAITRSAYDSQQNRAPEARIAIGALAFAVGLATPFRRRPTASRQARARRAWGWADPDCDNAAADPPARD